MVKATRADSPGPDDPIFQSGPQVFVPAWKPSTEDSRNDTSGETDGDSEKQSNATEPTESESMRWARSLEVEIGLDHPIYSNGLIMNSVRAPKPSTDDSQNDTAGTNRPEQPEQTPDPMD